MDRSTAINNILIMMEEMESIPGSLSFIRCCLDRPIADPQSSQCPYEMGDYDCVQELNSLLNNATDDQLKHIIDMIDLEYVD